MSHGECPTCHEKFHSKHQKDEHVCYGAKEPEKIEMKEECGYCKYWLLKTVNGNGKCRRYAPRLIVAGCGTGENPEYSRDWAITDCDESCGEFKVKNGN